MRIRFGASKMVKKFLVSSGTSRRASFPYNASYVSNASNGFATLGAPRATSGKSPDPLVYTLDVGKSATICATWKH